MPGNIPSAPMVSTPIPASAVSQPNTNNSDASSLPMPGRKADVEIASIPPALHSLVHTPFTPFEDPGILQTLITHLHSNRYALNNHAFQLEILPQQRNTITREILREEIQGALAITAVNKEAFKLRFHAVYLHHLSFENVTEITRCLNYCRDYVKEGGIRTPADLYHIKGLTLKLSDELSIEQSTSLLSYFSTITTLRIELEPGYSVASLHRLLEAAPAASLQELSIIKPTDHSEFEDLSVTFEEPEDFLPDEIFAFTNLQELYLENLHIRHISEKLGKLKELVSLELYHMPILDLPKSLGELTRLQNLILRELDFLLAIPEEMGQLTALKKVDVNLQSMRVLPKSLWDLPALEALTIENTQLSEIPEEIGNLTTLTHLELTNMEGIRELPNSLFRLVRLDSLWIQGLPILRIPEEISNLQALALLELYDLDQLDNLPHGIGNLSALRVLALAQLPKISELPQHISGLQALQFLTLRDLPNIFAFPAKEREGSRSTVNSLREEIGSVNLRSLPALTKLILEELPNLQKLPEELFLNEALTICLSNVPRLITPDSLKATLIRQGEDAS